ncbi:glycosyltransferase family 4 protein [Tuberibacillus calidus]|jgi:hypothetical protein|uniref:glycosyltransferase family 4 protein n=1 Tax=Tuberibacillus calidus TaxID=340097 RepID=UPI0003F89BF2|nr:glycosyltransferase family 4 protein [Tuberibacillus calidus]
MTVEPSRVYVLNAYDRYGGSYMLYGIGCVFHEAFGYPVIVVQTRPVHRGGFSYPYAFPVISLKDMLEAVRPADFFIASGADSSLNLGRRLKCHKIMYVQGTTPYTEPDFFYDQYVACSTFVAHHLKERFGIEARTIHPFINLTIFKNRRPWREREDAIAVSCYKKDTVRALSEIVKRLRRTRFKTRFHIKKLRYLPQPRLAGQFNRYKYFLTLSETEGFGLMPLEAMACGACVIGYDGSGGRDYFTEDNACVVPSGDDESLIEKMHALLCDPKRAQALAENGWKTAQTFTYKAFKNHWKAFLGLSA